MDIPSCSPLLIERVDGRKQYLSCLQQQKNVPRLYSDLRSQTFGVPSVITSDRGAQFTSSILTYLCKFLGIIHSPTTSFHPQSNGLVERFHHRLKVSLRARLSGTDWFNHLPLVLLGLRSVPRENSAIPASEALFGSPLVLSGEFLDSPELPSSEYLKRILFRGVI